MNLKFLLNKENKTNFLSAIAYFLVGVMFIVLPIIMLSSFESMICYLLLVYGGIILFANCVSPVVFQNKKLLISSIVSVVLGILLLLIRSFFVLVIGLFILWLVLFKIFVLKRVSNSKNVNWFLYLALCIIESLVFIFIIVSFILNKMLNISMILMGSCLILESVINIFMLIRNQQIYEKELSKKSEENEDLNKIN